MSKKVSNDRKAKVTAETLEESVRLRALWDTRPHASQIQFGLDFDIGNQSAVAQFLNGKVPLSMKAAAGFARGLGVELSEFSPRLAAEASTIAAVSPPPGDDDYVDVMRTDVKLGAGTDKSPAIVEQVGSLKFQRSFLRKCGVSPASARVVEVDGPSMEPTIPDGAVLLVNLTNQEPKNNAIFALSTRTGLLVKRLVKEGGRWMARSDNRSFSDIEISDGEPVEIVGRAVWMGVKL